MCPSTESRWRDDSDLRARKNKVWEEAEEKSGQRSVRSTKRHPPVSKFGTLGAGSLDVVKDPAERRSSAKRPRGLNMKLKGVVEVEMGMSKEDGI